MCRFLEIELVSKYWDLLIFVVRDSISTKWDFHYSSSPWFLLFMCFPSCTEVFETSVKDDIPGWLEGGCCSLCLFQYHFSYLNRHFVFKLWIYYGVNSCSSPRTDCGVICNANLHNAQHSFSPGHTAFSTKFIFMPFNWIIEEFFRPLFAKSHRGGGSWCNKNK